MPWTVNDTPVVIGETKELVRYPYLTDHNYFFVKITRRRFTKSTKQHDEADDLLKLEANSIR